MRPSFYALSFVHFILILTSCGQNSSPTLDYNKLAYDTNKITIFQWDTSKYFFPDNSNPLPLTREDLIIIDSLIKDAIDSFNHEISPRLYQAFDKKVPLDSFIIRESRYKYQYIPYKEVNGERIISIIGFLTDHPSWRTEIYRPRLHPGMRMLNLKINLTLTSRDDLRLGDFG